MYTDKNVKSLEEGLVYLADCSLATVTDLALKKKKKISEYSRQISIAQIHIDFIKKFKVVSVSGRAKDVIDMFDGDVRAYARSIEVSSMNGLA